MTRDKLAIDETALGFIIGWWLPDEGDFGAYLGQDYNGPKSPTNEVEAAEQAVSLIAPDMCPASCFLWDSRAAANRALKVANAAVKAFRAAKPWPDWAAKASSEGWTPPKGWHPE